MSAVLTDIDIGDSVVLQAAFAVAGVATAPTDPTIAVRKPSGGTPTHYTGGQLTTVSTGVYSVVITIDESGDWRWRAFGTGAATAAGERKFRVRRRYVI